MTSELAKPSVDPMVEFQQKLRDRVRNDIRDLLPEEALAELVKKAVHDEFFQKRKVPGPNNWSNPVDGPSLFVEEVVKAAKPLISEAVKKLLDESPQIVEKAIREFLDENRLAIMTTELLTGELSMLLRQTVEVMQSRR